MRRILACILSICIPFAPGAQAQTSDLFDTDSQDASVFFEEREKINPADIGSKSSEELLEASQELLLDERPLDARTLLLEVLTKNPKEYRAHILLAGYYLVHVGHFRLALKYVNQALHLFEEANGKPPYQSLEVKGTHARMLSLLAEVRLNLDNYKGALAALDEFSSLYFGDWYPGTRAWVLMKLGRIPEAIKVARLGVLSGAEPGRALNILGILLSMVGENQEALQVLDEATLYELALGRQGQPATPINNAGEIYREIFEDAKAEANWLKATGMRDGCEHILPTMNLALLYLDQLKFKSAADALDRFEQCIKQFPLRNGEEHRALLRLARGRIAMHTGQIDLAISNFEDALQRRQWFGKIGTNENDMKAASLISMAQALEQKNEYLKTTSEISSSWVAWMDSLRERAVNSWRSWWLFRRARQVLAGDLNKFEDLSIRNTDSMLEYSSLGQILSTFPERVIKRRIQEEILKDKRELAACYYAAYSGEAKLKHGNKSKGLELIASALQCLRPQEDRGLVTRLLALVALQEEPGSAKYVELTSQIYKAAPAWIRNLGLKLPVNFENVDKEMLRNLNATPLLLTNSQELAFKIKAKHTEGRDILYVEEANGRTRGPFEDSDGAKAVDKLVENLFTERL